MSITMELFHLETEISQYANTPLEKAVALLLRLERERIEREEAAAEDPIEIGGPLT